MVPLRVRAHLACGIAQAAPWGIALDGLLAAQLWAARKDAYRHAGQASPGLLDVDEPEDLPLPLARCTTATTTDRLWHWAATCAFPEGRPLDPPLPLEVRYWTGRVDTRAVEQLTTHLPGVLSERQGRYRSRHMPLLVTPCTAVVWHAVGDPAAITALVTGITAIGKKRSQGEGRVLGWDVTPAPDLTVWDASHLHPDATLGRPTPSACLTQHHPGHQAGHQAGHQVPDGGVGTAGLRPPYMHPARQHTLHLPALLES